MLLYYGMCVCASCYLCVCCTYIPQESEFSQSLGVSNPSLHNSEILIVWKWTWGEDDEEAEVTAPSEQDDNSESLPSDAEAES